MSYAKPLNELIGAEPAGQLIHVMAAALEYHDRLPAETAYAIACDRVADGDPLWIAAPGQTWVIHPDLAQWNSPHERLVIKQRTHTELLVVPVDPDGVRPEETIGISVLAMYQLETWLPLDPDLAAITEDGDSR